MAIKRHHHTADPESTRILTHLTDHCAVPKVDSVIRSDGHHGSHITKCRNHCCARGCIDDLHADLR
jgi:hypothetical protein